MEPEEEEQEEQENPIQPVGQEQPLQAEKQQGDLDRIKQTFWNIGSLRCNITNCI